MDYIFGNLRVQMLGDSIVHLERAYHGLFCNNNTLFVPNKTNFATADGVVGEKGNTITVTFGNVVVSLPKDSYSLAGSTIAVDGKVVYKYKKVGNSGELPPIDKTPAAWDITDNPRIVLTQAGYGSKTAKFRIHKGVSDVYVLLTDRSHTKLRKLFVDLCGNTDMVRLSTLGSWNSRYYRYTQQEAVNMIDAYAEHDIPLDNIVIDTDWRNAENGIGYDLNTKLFPDIKGFFNYAHSRGVEVMFNDHPEPVANAESMLDNAEMSFREDALTHYLELGLDYWWYDRNWMTALISPAEGINPETLGMFAYTEITKHYHQKKARNNTVFKRPTIMANVDNVLNGQYIGVQSSASHRFAVQWTGDIPSDGFSIYTEVENLVKGGNSLIGYINADCGGHTGNPNKQEFVRWMQFGTLSPVFRPHCTNYVERFREPWNYDTQTVDIVRDYVNMRYRLLPVIYRQAYQNYLDGTPIFAQTGWNYPTDKKACSLTDQYMLGKNLLIAPLCCLPPQKLRPNNYVGKVRSTFFGNRNWQGEPIWYEEYVTLDHDFAPNQKVCDHVGAQDYSVVFETSLYFNDDVELFIQCDDGATVWVDGELRVQDDTTHPPVFLSCGKVSKWQIHTIKVKYFQAGGGAVCNLQAVKLNSGYSLDARKVYLPQGKWMELFTGKIHVGGKVVSANCDLRQMPLYVRLGGIVPLIDHAHTTKQQDWNNITLDFYPDKDSTDSGTIYQDDFVTTAYKQGVFATTDYSAHFDSHQNAFVVTVDKAVGNYKTKDKTFTLKYHMLKGCDKVAKVLVNGTQVDFAVNNMQDVFPLGTSGASLDAKVLTVTANKAVQDKLVIQVVLK